MKIHPPSVHVLILNYRMRDQVRECLRSLARVPYPNLTTVVIDNNSADNIEQMLAVEFPHVVFLQTGVNLGYTGGNNAGIRHAINAEAEYVLVLNPDTVVLNPNFIGDMVSLLEANPRIGIAGPKVFYREAGQVQNTVLFAPGLWRNLANWFAYRWNPESFQLSGNKEVEAEVLNGVCLLIRADCLKQIGLFDENIFMYIEDADLDFRARQSGWSVRYLPIESVVHRQKSEGYDMTSQVSFLLRRNSVYYLCKVGKRAEAIGYALLSLLLLAARGAATFSYSGATRYWRFCRKVGASYLHILLNRPPDKSFGPPF
ncbi:MAG: glycosyltransferase family 2 protein [Acidobacteriota bacterium]|nr:glycosyltransferase family 2 protein [Acidobacteriota bacterium]